MVRRIYFNLGPQQGYILKAISKDRMKCETIIRNYTFDLFALSIGGVAHGTIVNR